MTRTTIFSAALLLFTGCAPTSGVSVAGLEPGTTAIRVQNHVTDGDVLDKITLTIDGQTLPLATIPPPGEAPIGVPALRLAPGQHTITVRAMGRSNGTIVVALAQQVFYLKGGPAAILVDVKPNKEERIAVDLSMGGGALGPAFGAAPLQDKDARCAPLLPIPKAICRAAVDFDEAARRRDIAAVMCVQEKLGEMRRLGIVAETSDRETTEMIERSVGKLSVETDACIGDLRAPQDGIRVWKTPNGASTATR